MACPFSVRPACIVSRSVGGPAGVSASEVGAEQGLEAGEAELVVEASADEVDLGLQEGDLGRLQVEDGGQVV